jgi:two-component system, NtrC family, sensor kinase
MNGAVLIVDDSLTVRMNLVELLEEAGLPVVPCATGQEARKALAKNEFSLVILDVLLPDADGIELLREIRATPRIDGTPVMLLSTESEVRHRIRGLTTGADEYVGKPYEPNYVVARARELVRRGQIVTEPSRETILIIDDGVTFREELKEALERASYRVVIAGTGEEGLRLAADLRPTGIIIDGVLPGIDGATVVRRIRLDAALRSLPCLLLTASEDVGAEVSALDAGADAFVRKEADIEIILARLNAVLRSAGAERRDQSTASLLGPKKVLAIDDSETFLQELADTLRRDGYEVVLAQSGEEALQLLRV